MVMVCPQLITVGCAFGSAISKIIYLTIILYSQIFAKIQTMLLHVYLKRPRMFFSSVLDTAHNDIKCSLKFLQSSFLVQTITPSSQ